MISAAFADVPEFYKGVVCLVGSRGAILRPLEACTHLISAVAGERPLASHTQRAHTSEMLVWATPYKFGMLLK